MKECSVLKIIGKRSFYHICFILLCMFTGVILFKNSLFYSIEKSKTILIDEFSMASYQNSGELFIPVDNTATIYLHDFDIKANELMIKFDCELSEDTTFTLYNSSSNVETYAIESKTIRKGMKTVNFYFEDIHINELKVLAVSSDGSHFVSIPKGEICIALRTIDFQGDILKLRLIAVLLAITLLLYILYLKCGKYVGFQVSNRMNRDSNLELLRIVCMLLLIGHHYATHGGLLNLDTSLPKYIGLIFLPTGKICFIAFVAISMYFLADAENKPQRFIKCWLEVLFYSVTLTIATWMMGGVVKAKDLISSFFVMIGNSHGFAASYLLFLLCYPFILKATKNCTKKQARYLLFLLFWIQIMSQILKVWNGYNQPVYSELTLFVFCYILLMNLKRYPLTLLENKAVDVMIIIGVWSYAFALNVILYSGIAYDKAIAFCAGITNDEGSVFYIAGGLALFYLFKNIHIPNLKIINQIAAGTFGVLLIHDHNFFRHMFWTEVIRVQTTFHSKNMPVYFLVTVFGIFICGVFIDYLRKLLIENPIINSKWYKAVSRKMEDLWKNA